MYKLMREKGINCFPLPTFSKIPVIKWTIYHTEKCDLPIQINYAVVCGKTSNNLFVVDLDTIDLNDDFKDFNTFTVKTGKGYHYYFYAKDGILPATIPLINEKGQKMDIRSQGAYVLGAGSLHEDRKSVYTIVNDAEIMEIDPTIIKERLKKLGFNVEFAKKRMVDVLKGAKEGERDMSAFRVAMCARHFWGLKDAELLVILDYYNQHYIFPPLSDLQIKQKVQSAMSYDIDDIKFKEILETADTQEIKLKYDDIFWESISDFCKKNNIKSDSLNFKCEICKTPMSNNPQDKTHKGHLITIIYK